MKTLLKKRILGTALAMSLAVSGMAVTASADAADEVKAELSAPTSLAWSGSSENLKASWAAVTPTDDDHGVIYKFTLYKDGKADENSVWSTTTDTAAVDISAFLESHDLPEWNGESCKLYFSVKSAEVEKGTFTETGVYSEAAYSEAFDYVVKTKVPELISGNGAKWQKGSGKTLA